MASGLFGLCLSQYRLGVVFLLGIVSLGFPGASHTLDRPAVRALLGARPEELKPSIETYGTWGLAIFIGIPLPLTGAYTGAAGAFALGMGKRQFMIANVVGVLLAGIVVTIISLLIQAGVESPWFDILIKYVQ